MLPDLSLKQMRKMWHGSLKGYLIGFFISLILTSASFLLVVYELLPPPTLLITITTLAILQAIVQLLCFLHLEFGGKYHWETSLFILMVTVLLIIVVGSLWVMNDLNHRTMSHMSHMTHPEEK
jgi:cytochrome o ubiquinol oxidase operon protein cyoD